MLQVSKIIHINVTFPTAPEPSTDQFWSVEVEDQFRLKTKPLPFK